MPITFEPIDYNKIKLGDTLTQVFDKFNAVMIPVGNNMVLTEYYLNEHSSLIGGLRADVGNSDSKGPLFIRVANLENSVGVDDGQGTLFIRVAALEEGKQDVSEKDTAIPVTPEDDHYPTTKAIKDYVDAKISDTSFFAVINHPDFGKLPFDGVVNYGDTIPTVGTYAYLNNDSTVTKYVNGVAIVTVPVTDGRMVYVIDTINGGYRAYYVLGEYWELLGPNLENYILKSEVDDSTIEHTGTTLQVKGSGIKSSHLASSSVTTVKIANQNVTTAKIADKAVTTVQLSDAINAALERIKNATNSVEGLVRGTAHITSGVTANWGMVRIITDTDGKPAMESNMPDWTKRENPPDAFGLTGGSSDEILYKKSATDFDVGWINVRTLLGVTDKNSNTALSGTNTNIPTERAIYFGLPSINGSNSYHRGNSIYAPVSSGTSNHILISKDSAAPDWLAPTGATSLRNNIGLGTGSGVLEVPHGGTGQTLDLTANAIITASSTTMMKCTPTANGAAYATSTNGPLIFGPLPIAQGGTGQTSVHIPNTVDIEQHNYMPVRQTSSFNRTYNLNTYRSTGVYVVEYPSSSSTNYPMEIATWGIGAEGTAMLEVMAGYSNTHVMQRLTRCSNGEMWIRGTASSSSWGRWIRTNFFDTTVGTKTNNFTWGPQIGTAIGGVTTSTNGDNEMYFRKDCPSSRVMSLILDGQVYVRNGKQRVDSARLLWEGTNQIVATNNVVPITLDGSIVDYTALRLTLTRRDYQTSVVVVDARDGNSPNYNFITNKAYQGCAISGDVGMNTNVSSGWINLHPFKILSTTGRNLMIMGGDGYEGASSSGSAFLQIALSNLTFTKYIGNLYLSRIEGITCRDY